MPGPLDALLGASAIFLDAIAQAAGDQPAGRRREGARPGAVRSRDSDRLLVDQLLWHVAEFDRFAADGRSRIAGGDRLGAAMHLAAAMQHLEALARIQRRLLSPETAQRAQSRVVRRQTEMVQLTMAFEGRFSGPDIATADPLEESDAALEAALEDPA